MLRCWTRGPTRDRKSTATKTVGTHALAMGTRCGDSPVVALGRLLWVGELLVRMIRPSLPTTPMPSPIRSPSSTWMAGCGLVVGSSAHLPSIHGPKGRAVFTVFSGHGVSMPSSFRRFPVARASLASTSPSHGREAEETRGHGTRRHVGREDGARTRDPAPGGIGSAHARRDGTKDEAEVHGRGSPDAGVPACRAMEAWQEGRSQGGRKR